jgi:hypothetical protein
MGCAVGFFFVHACICVPIMFLVKWNCIYGTALTKLEYNVISGHEKGEVFFGI